MDVTAIFTKLNNWVYGKLQRWYEKKNVIRNQINEISEISSEMEKILDDLKNIKGKIFKNKLYLSSCYHGENSSFELIGSEKAKPIRLCYKEIDKVSALCKEYNCIFDKLDEICRNNGYGSAEHIYPLHLKMRILENVGFENYQ